MDEFLSGLKTYTSKDLRKERKSDKATKLADQAPGQHANELNPYWKKGGDGLPSASSKPKSGNSADWLRRSLKRMQEQAKETGDDIEFIAANRYGSWDKFKSQLEEAESNDGIPASRRFSATNSLGGNNSKKRFMRPGEDNSSGRRRFMRPGEGPSRSRGGRKYDLPGDHQSWRQKNRDDHNTSREERRHDHDDQVHGRRKDRDRDATHKRDGRDEARRNENRERRHRDVSPSDTTEINSPPKQKKVESRQEPSPPQPQPSPPPSKPLVILTEKEKNKIGAKIIKYELMGKMDLVEKLKAKLERSKEAELNGGGKSQKHDTKHEEDDNVVCLTRTDRTGVAWPVKGGDYDEDKPKKKRKVTTFNKDGERERYFGDDDDYTLQDLVARERSGAGDDHSVMLSRMSAKMFRKTDGEIFTLDDMFESKVAGVSGRGEDDRRAHQKSIADTRKAMRRLEKCKYCYGNQECKQHLIVATGRHSYISIPSHRPLCDGHCFIVPMSHCASAMTLDEDIWAEIKRFMSSLADMFRKEKKDVLFLQYCARLKKSPHFYLECIPVPFEEGDMAPIYFKKALQDSEGNWSQNKKVVDTRGTGVRGKVPAGFPYFAVDFALDGGFAHVIENEDKFPNYFGREVIAGMLDLGPELWRKPHEEVLHEQTKRTLSFEKMYKEFDWTSEVMD